MQTAAHRLQELPAAQHFQNSKMIFHDYTLRADGSIVSHRVQETEKLVQEAVEIFSDLISGNDSFRKQVHPGLSIELYWTHVGETALATFYGGDNVLLTTSALTAGKDRGVLDELAGMAGRIFRQPVPRIEIDDRPLLVSLVWPFGRREDLALVADMETCLAAAFFSSIRRSRQQ